MNPRVLFIVTGDPRTSLRPAEAVRIAAGVGVWKKADVTVYLRENAVLALGEPDGTLLEEDNYTRYWPLLAEGGHAIYAQENAAALRKLGAPVAPFKEISDGQLAQLAAQQTCVLRF